MPPYREVLVNVYLFGGKYFIPTVGMSGEGIRVDGDPWAVVDDPGSLEPIVRARLDHGHHDVPLPDPYGEPEWQGAAVTGVERWSQFARKAKLYCVVLSPDHAEIQLAAIRKGEVTRTLRRVDSIDHTRVAAAFAEAVGADVAKR